jgi:uncharacterized protein YjbI with pentapeptide repeats
LKSHGIQHQTSTLYTLQQNGVAKWLNCTIWNQQGAYFTTINIGLEILGGSNYHCCKLQSKIFAQGNWKNNT